MMQSIEDAVKINDEKVYLSNLAYYDDALGIIIESINSKTLNMMISNYLLQQHIAMIKLLIVIFTHNPKNVRPLRLFDSNIHFCSSLLVSLQSPINSMDLVGKIDKEREMFVEKIIEASPSKTKEGLYEELSW